MFSEKEILVMAIAGVALVLFLATVFILSIARYRRRIATESEERIRMAKRFEQELLQSKLETQEETFRHIAQELHDNVGQLLSSTKMLMGVAQRSLGEVPETLITANSTLSKAIQELRLLSRSLDKQWLEQFNLVQNLQTEIDHINAAGTIKATLECSTTVDMNHGEQLLLYRILQEAIQNAIRHADPTHIRVIITGSDPLVLKVINNGNPLPKEFMGMGTTNMRDRAQLFGGSVEWKPSDEETTVIISLPLLDRNISAGDDH